MSYRTWPMLPFALFGHQTRRIACRGVDSVYTGDLDSGKAEKLIPIRRVSQRDLNFAVEEAESERERERAREKRNGKWPLDNPKLVQLGQAWTSSLFKHSCWSLWF